ncbi:cell division protein ZapB [Veillonella parvula]|uniref:cell division protein ZapB n=1 Tax=Veillonella parvula TaxID=29466 RepID=UPI0026ED7DD1|nr:cell division protein ZapB [Veillonella parvula]
MSNLIDAGKQQVKDISAWNVTTAGGTVEKVQGGDTVKFQAGDNLVVNQDRTTFIYGLAKDLKGLNSVIVGDENGVSTKITPAGTTVKDVAGNSTVINDDGMTITPADAVASPVSLTVDGLNNGGSRERKDAIPERYKAGPISSVYVMQDEVSILKKENSNQKTVIANQAARLNTLEAENERQRQELAETKQGLDDLLAVLNQLLASKG